MYRDNGLPNYRMAKPVRITGKNNSFLSTYNGGLCFPLLFTSHSYCHLEGHFWLKWQDNKLG